MICFKTEDPPKHLEEEAKKLHDEYMAIDEPDDVDDYWPEYLEEHASAELLKWRAKQKAWVEEMEKKGCTAG